MQKAALALVALLVLCAPALGASYKDALDAASPYLEPGETSRVSPLVRFSHQDSSYWVVTLQSGEDTSGYLAFDDDTLELLLQKSANEQVFTAVAYAQGFLDLRESAARQNQWFFTQSNADYFRNLASRLDQERENDLAYLAGVLDSAEIDAQASDMQDALSELAEDARNMGDLISTAMDAERAFFKSPSALGRNALRAAIDDVGPAADAIAQQALDYDAQKSRLKQLILAQNPDDAPVLLAYADPPAELLSVLQKKTMASTLVAAQKEVNARATQNAITFAEAVPSRVQKRTAFETLFGHDGALEGATQFSTLEEAHAALTDERVRALWSDQAALRRLDTAWRNANAAYDAHDYANAAELGAQAKREALLVSKSGRVAPADDASLSEGAVQLLVVLVGAAIAFALLKTLLKPRPKKEKGGGRDYELRA